jgi:hypothetical protein
MTWDEFCEFEIGLTRTQVEKIIGNVQEFGESYCQLSHIVRVSAETFRAIAPRIDGETIEIDGQAVPILPENAPRIRAAVHQIRENLRQARETAKAGKNTIDATHARLARCVAAIARLGKQPLEPADADTLRAAIEESLTRLTAVHQELACRQ